MGKELRGNAVGEIRLLYTQSRALAPLTHAHSGPVWQLTPAVPALRRLEKEKESFRCQPGPQHVADASSKGKKNLHGNLKEDSDRLYRERLEQGAKHFCFITRKKKCNKKMVIQEMKTKPSWTENSVIPEIRSQQELRLWSLFEDKDWAVLR